MRSFFRGQHYLPARLWREITAPAAAAVILLHAAWIAAWECRFFLTENGDPTDPDRAEREPA